MQVQQTSYLQLSDMYLMTQAFLPGGRSLLQFVYHVQQRLEVKKVVIHAKLCYILLEQKSLSKESRVRQFDQTDKTD